MEFDLFEITNYLNYEAINRIKLVLVAKNKTAKWLFKHVGRNVTSVSCWCTNASQPDLETLFRIVELLDVGVRELLHVEKDKSN